MAGCCDNCCPTTVFFRRIGSMHYRFAYWCSGSLDTGSVDFRVECGYQHTMQFSASYYYGMDLYGKTRLCMRGNNLMVGYLRQRIGASIWNVPDSYVKEPVADLSFVRDKAKEVSHMYARFTDYCLVFVRFENYDDETIVDEIYGVGGKKITHFDENSLKEADFMSFDDAWDFFFLKAKEKYKDFINGVIRFQSYSVSIVPYDKEIYLS